MDDQTLSDIQGIVLFAYRRFPRSVYLVLRLGDDPAVARDWLAGIVDNVPGSGKEEKNAEDPAHVAFTASGLERLGVPAGDVAAAFPRELVKGMNDADRSKVLGDLNDDAPKTWEFGGPEGERVDALLMLYGTQESIEPRRSEHEKRLEDHGIHVVARHDTYRRDDAREHFGFHDGISQPYVLGSARPMRAGEHPVEPGEFVLGQTNEYGRASACPTVPAQRDAPPALRAGDGKSVRLGLNGSYLVYRKMAQDVEAFWRYAFDAAEPEGTDTVERAAVRIASGFVGRWPGGAPLVLSPDRDREGLASANRFLYRDLDPLGHRCPLGAHVRRTHPRDMLGSSASHSLLASSRHRIIRRGRLYGPELQGVRAYCPEGRFLGFRPATEAKKQDRGLIFIALNANIRRQFEFVQQTWVNARQFAGLYDERDPLVGADVRSHPDPLTGRTLPSERVFTLPGDPVRKKLFDLPRFVRIRGGAYFFLPGRNALSYLAGVSRGSPR